MIAYSHDYSTKYYPPAPVIEMAVRDVERQEPEIIITALADYGSDVTMIPINVLRAVGALHVEKRRIRGISGVAYSVDTYLVTVRIGPHLIRAIKAVAAVGQQETLIGRDVLNNLVVTLNGLASVTEVEG